VAYCLEARGATFLLLLRRGRRPVVDGCRRHWPLPTTIARARPRTELCRAPRFDQRRGVVRGERVSSRQGDAVPRRWWVGGRRRQRRRGGRRTAEVRRDQGGAKDGGVQITLDWNADPPPSRDDDYDDDDDDDDNSTMMMMMISFVCVCWLPCVCR